MGKEYEVIGGVRGWVKSTMLLEELEGTRLLEEFEGT